MKNKKNMKSSKGFTLIELLAVIVILGILLMTAIPAVTRNIAKSRKNTYWQNAKEYISAVATPFLAGEYYDVNASGAIDLNSVCGIPAPGSGVYVYLKDIELEKGSTEKSAFGAKYQTTGNCQPAIIVVNEGKTITTGGVTETADKLVWYFVGTDQTNNGISTPTKEGLLNSAAVKTGNATSCTAKPSTVTNAGATAWKRCVPQSY